MSNYKTKQDKELIFDYQKNNNELAKEELLHRYQKIIEKITLKYANRYSIPYEDLLGNSYIGFLLSINDYNSNIQTDFYRYSRARIYQYLDLAYIKLNIGCFMESDKLKIIKKHIQEVEKLNNINIYENPNIIYEIIDLLDQEDKLSEYNKEDLRIFIESQINPKPLNINISYSNYNIEAINSIAKEVLTNAINELKEPYKSVIGYIYGFKDGYFYKQKEIAKLLNITISKVEYLKNKGLKMLLKNLDVKKLRGILDIYNQVEYNNYKEKTLKKTKLS